MPQGISWQICLKYLWKSTEIGLDPGVTSLQNVQLKEVTVNCFILPFLLFRGSLMALPEAVPPAEAMERSVYVSIEEQVIVFFQGDREANLALVSTGRPPVHSTPTGEFSVLYKRWAPVSSTYRVRMPFWQCIEPSGAIGLHQASPSVEHRLGEPLSHGCVRLGYFTARWAYYWLPVGAKVVIE